MWEFFGKLPDGLHTFLSRHYQVSNEQGNGMLASIFKRSLAVRSPERSVTGIFKHRDQCNQQTRIVVYYENQTYL